MRPLSFTFFLASASAYLPLILAGTGNKSDPCNVGNSRLQDGTYQFWSECNSVTFCSDQGICELKGCRKDDFPFGYPTDSDILPDKCPKGEFCPDEGSSCQPLTEVGGACQFNRDDQCLGPPDFKDLTDTTGRGLNVNGSVCLNNICMFANVTAGGSCVVENTAYTGYAAGDTQFPDIVSRGNCRVGLYCDSVSLQCLTSKAVGDACTADKECDSWNCESTGFCGDPAATPRHFGIYVYILVALGIFGGMAGTLTGLYFAHRKQREVERNKRAQYWREQNAFHQNLMNMRETARASILSLPKNGGSRDYSRDPSDESSTPILHSGAPKASGLRHYTAEDGSSEYDDGLMYTGKRNDARF